MSNYTRWYREGTVSGSAGSNTVNGTGTYWKTAGLNTGDILKLGGNDYEVLTVKSDTQLTISGTLSSAVSGASYAIVRNFTSTMSSKIASEVAGLLGDYARYLNTEMATIYGKSAYEIAKANGFTGTEAQWLESLKAAGELTELKSLANSLIVHNAASHNSHCRGKLLGNTITAAQSAAIRAGTFEDIYPNDYWQVNNLAYTYVDENNATQSDTYTGTLRVVDCDYFYSLLGCNTHHVVVVPDIPLYFTRMNDEVTTEGGYVGTKMRAVNLNRAKAIFKAVFGADHLLTHTEYLVNAVTDGHASGAIICNDCVVEIMDQRMLFGSLLADSATLLLPSSSVITPYGNVAYNQFSAFLFNNRLIDGVYWTWTRNIVSSVQFAAFRDNGLLGCFMTNAPGGGVRPYVLIY